MQKGIATTAVLIAVAVAVGLLLAPVPNVEGISAVCFISGFLLGWKRGGLVGATAMVLLSLLNPLGPAPPPVFAGQVIGMGTIGMAGDLLKRTSPARARLGLYSMAFGAVLTLIYDIITNYGVAVSIGRWRNPAAILLAGVPFSAIHVVTNTVIFGAAGALVARRRRHRSEN